MEEMLTVRVPAAALRKESSHASEQVDEVLFGESVFVLGNRMPTGWIPVRTEATAYEGFVQREALSLPTSPPSHRTTEAITRVYREPSMTSFIEVRIGMNSLIRCRPVLSAPKSVERFAPVIDLKGWVRADHLAPVDRLAEDWVAEGLKCVGVPYVWGGRNSAVGLDCSGLVWNALAAAGVASPRDSGPMEQALGTSVPLDGPLVRGDLVFWKGHVGIMLDDTRLLEASGHAGKVRIEPLSMVTRERRHLGKGEITSIKRLEK